MVLRNRCKWLQSDFDLFFRSAIQSYFGCPGKAYLYEKNISFQIMYGMRGYESDGEHDNAKNGLLSASRMMKEIRRISNVKTILIGVSTGNLSRTY